MEIQQLRVKITAEMANLRSSLNEVKSRLQQTDKKVEGVQHAFDSMTKSAQDSTDGVVKAVGKTREELQQIVSSVDEVIAKYKDLNGAMAGYSSSKVFKIDMEEARKELEETKTRIQELYQELDDKQAALSNITDPTELARGVQEIAAIHSELDQAEASARELAAQLILGGKGSFNTTKHLEELKLKLQQVKEARDQAMADLANMAVHWNTDETQEQIRLVAQLDDEYSKLYAQALAAHKTANPEPPKPEHIDKWAELKDTVRGLAANFGKVISKAFTFKNIAKGIWSSFTGIASAMKKLNPLPKLLSKLGSAFSRLGHKIRTAFIFSVINSWFHQFRDRIASYLKINDELVAALSALKGTFLTAFQPIYEAMIPALIAFINWLSTALNTLVKFISLLSGKTVAQMQANAQALYEQANGYEAAGGAAADAAKTIAAFDELNVLNGPKSGGGGSSGGTEIGIDFPDLEEADEFTSWGEVFSNILDKLIAKLPTFNDLLQGVAEKINTFSGKVLEMFNFPGVDEKLAQLGSGLADSFNNMWDTIDWTQLGGSVGAALDGLFTFVLNYLKERDWTSMGSDIADLINGAIDEIDWNKVGELLISGWNIVWKTFNGFVSELDWKDLGDAISTAFESALENLDFESFVSSVSHLAVGVTQMIATAVTQTDWNKVGKTLINAIKTFIETMDWSELVKALSTLASALIAAAIRLSISFIWEGFKSAINAIKNDIIPFFQNQIEACGGDIGLGIERGILRIFAGIAMWIYDNILKPFIDGFKQAFGIHSPSTVMEEYGVYIVEGLWNGIKETWDRLVAWITGVYDDFKRLCENTWDSIRSTAANTWNNIKNEITTKISDIKSKVSTVWTELKGNTISAFNSLKTVASSIWSKISVNLSSWADSIGSKVSEAFTGLKTTVINVFDAMKEAIKVPINAIIGFINGLISGVVSGLNSMIRAMNSLHFDVPDWVPWMGGKTFGFNIGYLTAPQIPLLAKGGVITEPTMAMIGEYAGAKSNPEIVAPQDMLRETMIAANGEMVAALYQIATQIIQVIDEKDLEVSIGDDIIAQSAKRGADNYRRRTGRLLFA